MQWLAKLALLFSVAMIAVSAMSSDASAYVLNDAQIGALADGLKRIDGVAYAGDTSATAQEFDADTSPVAEQLAAEAQAWLAQEGQSAPLDTLAGARRG